MLYEVITGNGGADIFPENQGHARLERDQAGGGQGDSDPDGGAAALHDHGQQGADQDAQQGMIADHDEDIAKFLARFQWGKGLFHDLQAEKQVV